MRFEDYNLVGFKNVIASTPLIMEVDEADSQTGKERYKSLYRFNEEIINLKSLGNIPKGTMLYADYLAFDIDQKDLSDAHMELGRLVEYLDFREVGYELWFSGSKGFHIMVPTSQFEFKPTDNTDILKRLAEGIGEASGITIDTSIYNASRVFRMGGSINPKTGLYKVPVSPTDSLEDILEKAKSPKEDPYPEPDDYGVNDVLMAAYEEVQGLIKVNRTIAPVDDPKNTRIVPTGIATGGRNEACYTMARKLARRGVAENDAKFFCEAWSNSLPEPMESREVSKTVSSAYTKGVNELVDESNFSTHFHDAMKSLNSVRRLVANLNSTVVRTGYSFIDDYTMGLWKGDMIFMIARPGNFKTCILSGMLQKIAQTTKKKAIMFSMEMNPDRLNMRHMQAAEGFDQIEVIDAIRNGHEFNNYKEEYKDVEVVGLSALTVEMVLGMVDWFLENHGAISAIGFDYLSLFRGCANNTETTARLATELKTRIAKAANCPTFCLVQGKRAYEGFRGNIEIDKQAGKDSSSIEDSGDYLLGFWNHNGKNYGRFLKSRAFNSKYEEGPYFELDIDKPHMRLKDIKYIVSGNVPTFEQLPKGGKYD